MTELKLRTIFAGAILLLLGACTEPAPVFHADERPLRLSDWQLFTLQADSLTPSESSVVFRPNNPLFTDYAHKLRTLWIPAGLSAELLDDELSYPVGTILSKTFYYPRAAGGSLRKAADPGLQKIDLIENQLIETRLLVRKSDGWDAFPYVWNDEQTEAFLRIAGASKAVSLVDQEQGEAIDFTYFVPNENQCAGCHTTVHPNGDMHPLGAIYSQLNARASEAEGDSTLAQMVGRGWLSEQMSFPGSVAWQDSRAPLPDRALAYLNMQCGHCHNASGAADTSGLILDNPQASPINRGVCKPPVAAGGGAGNLRYSIVPGQPQQSILLYRMRSEKPDEMMPELGRSLIHNEGIELISRWIGEMSGSC
ncbi:MAG: SO2930 family diheme c-type cytochrome [Pseudohongiellaceae bacterium]